MYYKCDVYCLVSLILRFYLFPINLLNSCFLSLSFFWYYPVIQTIMGTFMF